MLRRYATTTMDGSDINTFASFSATPILGFGKASDKAKSVAVTDVEHRSRLVNMLGQQLFGMEHRVSITPYALLYPAVSCAENLADEVPLTDDVGLVELMARRYREGFNREMARFHPQRHQLRQRLQPINVDGAKVLLTFGEGRLAPMFCLSWGRAMNGFARKGEHFFGPKQGGDVGISSID